jgi:ureidoacrylate peracid hydrolase
MQARDSRSLAPERCAVVVIDLQNDYCHDDGTFAQIGYDVARAQAIIGAVNELVELAHRLQVPVVYLRTTHGPWTDAPAWLRRPRAGDADIERKALVQAGTWGAELYGVSPQARDLVLTKHRYSGFAYTPLELALRAKCRDTVVLAGALTDVCVEATAIDAGAAGFFAVLVPECTVAATDTLQSMAETSFADHIGAVVGLRELQTAWGGSTET